LDSRPARDCNLRTEIVLHSRKKLIQVNIARELNGLSCLLR